MSQELLVANSRNLLHLFPLSFQDQHVIMIRVVSVSTSRMSSELVAYSVRPSLILNKKEQFHGWAIIDRL
jgi:hypothetical protein